MDNYQKQEAIHSHNLAYLNSNSMQLRLETDQLIEQIRCFLSGTQLIPTKKENGEIVAEYQQIGKALLNEKGVSNLVNYCRSIINPSVVQGNYTEEWYFENLMSTHNNLAYILTVNSPYWNIDDNNRVSIISFIMELVKPFLSRLIDNEERKSYAATIKTNESNVTTQDPGLLSRVSV